MLLNYLAGVLLFGHASAYKGFADLEELQPRPLHDFCDKDVKEGPRHCEGSVDRTIEDGIIRLKWAMHADPDRILSVDVEQQKGLKILKCTPSSMELELPQSLVWHARVGQLIVASEQSHECEHYAAINEKFKEENGEHVPTIHDLYRRVTRVINTQWLNEDGSLAAGSTTGKRAIVKLWTQELQHVGEAVSTVAYEFDFIPVEVLQKQAQDEAKRKRKLQARMNFDANDFQKPGQGDKNAGIPWKGDTGGPLLKGTSVVTDDVKSLLNYKPKQSTDFSWNWDFGINSTRDVWYNYTLHGSKMHLLLRNPALMAHNQLSLRFRSYTPHDNAQDSFFSNEGDAWTHIRQHASANVAGVFDKWEPRVKFIFEMNGHGFIRANVNLQMDSRLDDVDSNPLKSFAIPVARELWKPKCLGKIPFMISTFPVTFSPCVEFDAKFYHYGRFHGSFGMGVSSHLTYKPQLQFDSLVGMRVNLEGKATDVLITPPNWMLKTSHFECGFALEPKLILRGQLGHNIRQTSLVLAFRPYVNMSVTREGHNFGGGPAYTARELIIYPYRITGNLRRNEFYMVRVATEPWDNFNEKPILDRSWIREKSTTPTPCWGEVEFMDPIREFSFGTIAQQDLLKMKIKVTVVKVTETGQETPISLPQTLTCHSEADGVCQPSPMIAEFTQNTKVYLHAVWSDDPQTFFTSKFKGVSVFIPELIINKQHIEKAVPGFQIDQWQVGTGSVSGPMTTKPIIAVITHGGRSYPMNMNKAKGYVPTLNSTSLTSDMVFDLGCSFISTWNRALVDPSQELMSTEPVDPKITIYIGNKEVAVASLPSFERAGEESVKGSIRMAQAGLHKHAFGSHAGRDVPVSVALNGVGGDVMPNVRNNIGMARLMFNLAGPTSWNRFIAPKTAEYAVPGKPFTITWTIAGVQEQLFTIRFLKQSDTDTFGDPKLYVDATGHPEFVPQIGDWAFEEVKTMAVTKTIAPRDTSVLDAMAISKNRYDYVVTLNDAQFTNKRMMVMVDWTDADGFHHSMPSPPILVVPNSTITAINDVKAREAKKNKEWRDKDKKKKVESLGAYHNIERVYNHRRLFWPFDGPPPMSTPAPLLDHPQRMDEMWDQHIEGCEKKDLHFKYGAGMSVKAYVKHLSLPADLPVLGGINNAPEIGTPWIQVFKPYVTSPQKLRDILPRLFCRHGLCTAALPGCSKGQNTTFHPAITVTYHHTFSYDQLPADMDAQMKQALPLGFAYAFATLPEVVHLILHYTNSSVEQQNIRNNVTTIPPGGRGSGRRRSNKHSTELNGEVVCENRGFDRTACARQNCCVFQFVQNKCESGVGNGPCLGGFRGDLYETAPEEAARKAALPPTQPPYVPTVAPVVTAAPVVAAPTLPPAVAGAAPIVPTVLPPTVVPSGYVIPAFGGRRLEEDIGEEGRQPNTRSGRMTVRGKVTLQFKGGLPYEVDRLLMDEMIKRGMFRENMKVHDDDEFDILSYSIKDIGPQSKFDDEAEVMKARYASTALFAVLGGVLLGVVALLVRRSRTKTYQRVEDSSTCDQEMLEIE